MKQDTITLWVLLIMLCAIIMLKSEAIALRAEFESFQRDTQTELRNQELRIHALENRQ